MGNDELNSKLSFFRRREKNVAPKENKLLVMIIRKSFISEEQLQTLCTELKLTYKVLNDYYFFYE